MDLRTDAIVILAHDGLTFEDKTAQVFEHEDDGTHASITFAPGGKVYRYSSRRVLAMRDPRVTRPRPDAEVRIGGVLHHDITEVLTFDGPDGPWSRTYDSRAPATVGLYRGDVEVVEGASGTGAAAVLRYWRELVTARGENDPLRWSYDRLGFIDPQSALARYLDGSPTELSTDEIPAIFPFSHNTSQRLAVETALSSRLSVIDGPPGTGKTQTILNLIASVVAVPGATVGVVSFSNAAVENIRDKLAEEGIGFVAADLGRREKRDAFFENQPSRDEGVERFLDETSGTQTSLDEVVELDRELGRLQQIDRECAEDRSRLDAYQLEYRHFRERVSGLDLPDVSGLKVSRGPAERILDLLATTEGDDLSSGSVRRLWRSLRLRLAFGSLRGHELSSTAVALALQEQFYVRRISEVERQVAEADEVLRTAQFDALAQEHRRRSSDYLRSALRARYSRRKRVCYSPGDLRDRTSGFTDDYPVILSTCHSIRQSIPPGMLLDYLIVDEASQVDLLSAGLALSVCRNLVVVGDLAQLAHIADASAASVHASPPSPAYDYVQHNILSSVIALHGDGLPRTLLREHYRCAPSIIGFCNKKFYGGSLIPYTRPDMTVQPLMVVRTAAGNHMRSPGTGRGSTNQREVDVIVDEVIPTYFPGAQPSSIGITTPYRQQVEKLVETVDRQTRTDTVHKFQGREKDIIIMSTVLDESSRGRSALRFVDDPRMVNVAVSRAVKQFALVTHHGLLPESTHLRDLIGYIRYQQPDRAVVDSEIVSVFDLLYREYSERLRGLASRVVVRSGFRSEDIVWAVLTDLLADQRYEHLSVVGQVLLRTLVSPTVGLTPRQAGLVERRGSVDLVVYNTITNEAVMAIEVDGHAFHEADPAQRERDAIKDTVLAAAGLPLLRLPTTGHGEERRIRQMLDAQLVPSQRLTSTGRPGA